MTAAIPRRVSTARCEVADWTGFAGAQGGIGQARQAARHRACDLYRGLRPCAVAHRGAPWRARRPVRERDRARAPDRRHHGADRHAQSRPGTRDDLRPDRVGEARHADRSRSRSCSAIPTRCSSVSAPTARARSRSADRRSQARPTRSSLKGKKIAAHLLEASDSDIEFEAGLFRVSGTDRTKSFEDDRGRGLHAGQLSAGDPRARPRGAGVLRSGELHLSRAARTSPKSRSIPAPASCDLLSYVAVDDIGTRHQPDDRRRASSMAASSRASARRCSRIASTTTSPASSCPARSWITRCRAPTACRTW